MDYEQIIKQVDWLDEERRKDKMTIATLVNRIDHLEQSQTTLVKQNQELESELSRINVVLARVDQLDNTLAQAKTDFGRSLETLEKQRMESNREMDKMRRADLEAMNRMIGEMRKELESLGEVKKSLQLRVEEEFRLGRLISEFQNTFEDYKRTDEEYRRAQRLSDEGRRQDSKRLVDLQGEVAALRKRSDEHRGKIDLNSDSIKKLEARLNETQAAETERKQAQNLFIEKQNMLQVDRDRIWQDWEKRFEDINRQATNLDSQLQALEATNRSLKRSQDAFEEISQKFERRVNEITEMQRLVEERFRQEWATFKADDQKRWTNYSLAQEELFRETGRQIEKQQERLLHLDDTSQEMRDLLHQITENTVKQMQGLLSLSQLSLEEYERNVIRTRQSLG